MKIGIIGGGVSGTTFAINYQRKHPQDEVLIFEHTDKLLKKILSTGNGKCNIANAKELSRVYNDEYATSVIEKYNYHVQNDFLNSLNIKTKLVNDLSYPISESAVTVRNAFLKEIDRLGIKIIDSVIVNDYKNKGERYQLFTDKGIFEVDTIIISVGGKSLPKSGSDGSFFTTLINHGYKIKDFNPGLCPIYTKEKTKILDGTRVKGKVSLFKEKQLVFEEIGEILFKEHGLSGIVIFNASRIIAQDIDKNYKITIDLLPDVSKDELLAFLSSHDKSSLLESYLHPNLVKYLLDFKGDIVSAIKGLPFTFDKLYGFENSQISVGGVLLNNLNNKLESKLEKNVYFLGEAINIDAPCGGYNLMWAIGSALYLSDRI